jgi:anti-anti-sigma factor
MELTLVTHDGYVLAKTKGPLDDSAREPFREQLHPLFAKPNARLIIDLGGSPRINSQGIGNLVALVADANTNNSRVIFCNLMPFVATVISVTRLDRFFEIVASLEEAVKRISAQG